MTVPQRAESDFTEAQPEVEPEVAPEWYAAESEPPTETAQHMTAPEAKDFEVSLCIPPGYSNTNSFAFFWLVRIANVLAFSVGFPLVS